MESAFRNIKTLLLQVSFRFGVISESANPEGGNQNNCILYCASPKAIQFLSFPFFSLFLQQSMKAPISTACTVMLVIVNQSDVYFESAIHGPKFSNHLSSTVKVSKNQARVCVLLESCK